VAPHRGAFSLLELLVVLGILMVFLGLTLGAVMRTPRVNAAVATAHMVSDLVRQGGHAARTSGTPVVIEIYHDSQDILGISQVPIQRMRFDDLQGTSTASDALTAAASDPCGFTGRGLRIADLGNGGTAMVVAAPTSPNLKLTRASTNGHVEGFYLACAVRPPVPRHLGGGLYPQNLLLVAVNGPDDQTSTCGLELKTSEYAVQPTPPANPALTNPPPLPDPVAYLTYNLCGWVATDQGPPTTVQTQNVTNDPNGTDVAGPLAGGDWVQVGLLYDGTNLELFIDGRQATPVVSASGNLVAGSTPGETTVGAFTARAATDTDPLTSQLYSDEIAVVPGSDDGTINPKCRWRVSTGTVDEVRIDRLGVDRAARLPNAVSANADFRITCQPDGRVDTNAGGGQLTFTTPGQGSATVAVATDGAVTTAVTP
jgi:type II secretory pathway pseudopilin PulG